MKKNNILVISLLLLLSLAIPAISHAEDFHDYEENGIYIDGRGAGVSAFIPKEWLSDSIGCVELVLNGEIGYDTGMFVAELDYMAWPYEHVSEVTEEKYEKSTAPLITWLCFREGYDPYAAQDAGVKLESMVYANELCTRGANNEYTFYTIIGCENIPDGFTDEYIQEYKHFLESCQDVIYSAYYTTPEGIQNADSEEDTEGMEDTFAMEETGSEETDGEETDYEETDYEETDDEETDDEEMDEEETDGEETDEDDEYDEASTDFETEDLYGNPVRMSDIYAQHEITMVNMWATWCPHCVEELPALEEINSHLNDIDCGIIGILTDSKDQEKVELGIDLLNEAGVTYPVFKAPTIAFYVFECTGQPMTYFVNRSGKIVGSPIEGAEIDKYEGAVRDLAAQAAAASIDPLPLEDMPELKNGLPETLPDATGYRVICVDDSGAPVEGVDIQFCTTDVCMMGITDGDGVAEFDASPSPQNMVHILNVPEGYASDNGEYQAPESYGDIIVTLQKE